MKFSDLNKIYLYGGSLPFNRRELTGKPWVGLSLNESTHYSIIHDLTYQMPLQDNSVSIFQLEDVIEHIEYNEIPPIINEIYRVLLPSGFLRLSVPNYDCKYLIDRTEKNPDTGELLFDAEGGGEFIDGKVTKGGHLWFPTYNNMRTLLDHTAFRKREFLHYIDNGKSVINYIDYSDGYIARTPDNDKRTKEPLSIVVDLFK